jgi:hypothetical protein
VFQHRFHPCSTPFHPPVLPPPLYPPVGWNTPPRLEPGWNSTASNEVAA